MVYLSHMFSLYVTDVPLLFSHAIEGFWQYNYGFGGLIQTGSLLIKGQ